MEAECRAEREAALASRRTVAGWTLEHGGRIEQLRRLVRECREEARSISTAEDEEEAAMEAAVEAAEAEARAAEAWARAEERE